MGSYSRGHRLKETHPRNATIDIPFEDRVTFEKVTLKKKNIKDKRKTIKLFTRGSDSQRD